MLRRLEKVCRPVLTFCAWSFGNYLSVYKELILSVIFFLFWPREYLKSLILGFLFGIFLFSNQSHKNPGAESYYGRVSINIQKLNEVRKKGILTGYGEMENQKVFFKIPIISWNGIDSIGKKSQIVGFAKCRKIKESRNPFSFNFQLQIKGIKYLCDFKSYSILYPQRKSNFENFLAKKKSSLPDFFEVKNLILSFTLGEINNLNPRIESLFRQTGLYHLLVLSGYQLMLLAFLLTQIISTLRYKFNLVGIISMFFTKVIIIIGLLVYSLYVGLDKPLLRALLFLIFLELAKFDHKISPLLYSAYFVCAIEPGAQFTLSFLLTFAALLGFCFATSFSGLWYGFFSCFFASCFSSLILFIYGHGMSGNWVVFNLLFGFPLSIISTALGAIALIEFLFFDTIFLWFLVSLLTKLILILLQFADQSFYVPSALVLIALPILSIFSLQYYFKTALMKKIFRRKRSYFKTPHQLPLRRISTSSLVSVLPREKL